MLTDAEVARIKFEGGYSQLDIGAEPYIQWVAIFTQVIKPFMLGGALTTCSTQVPTPRALPTPTILTLVSTLNFNVGDSVIVDVDGLAESVTIQAILGTTITVLLELPHTGTYPVVDVTTSVSTTSNTIVTAIPQPPAQVVLTLASAVGFHINDTVIVDDDARQESTKVIAVSGNTITVYLAKGHAGTYQVTVEGGESIVRGILQILQTLQPLGGNARTLGGYLGQAADGAGIKKVDEIEFFGPSIVGGAGASLAGNTLQQTFALIEYWRDELYQCLGIYRLNDRRGGGCLSVY
jgi:hypothetical protein